MKRASRQQRSHGERESVCGDGGSRTRVRGEDHPEHYMRSQSFELHPAISDRQAIGGTTPGVRACGAVRMEPPGASPCYPVKSRRRFGNRQASSRATGHLSVT